MIVHNVMASLSDVSTIIAAVSVIITVILHFTSRRTSRQVDTFNALNELYDAYYDLSGKTVENDYHEFVRFMSRVDRFSMATINGIYDIKVVKQKASVFLKEQYQRFMKKLIEDRRKQFGRDNYYKSIEDLINRI